MLSIQELRSSTVKELLQELTKMRKEMVKVRLTIRTKHDKNLSKAKKTKRYIAQLLTMIKEAGSEEATKAPSEPKKSKEEQK